MTYNELEELLNERGISKMDFCRETDISPQILTNAKSRGGHFSGSTMRKMQNFLNNNVIVESELTLEEKDLIHSFRNLDEESQRQLVLMLAFLKDQEKKK